MVTGNNIVQMGYVREWQIEDIFAFPGCRDKPPRNHSIYRFYGHNAAFLPVYNNIVEVTHVTLNEADA